jgi:adenine-specific DNA-methyltransferase
LLCISRLSCDKDWKDKFKILNSIVNSKLIAFWLKHKGRMQGNNYQIDKEPLLALPIIKLNENEQKEIIELVNKILSLTQFEDYLKNPQKQAKVKEYERQIDWMIYRLYGLTDEEIKIVEDFEKK